MSSSLEIHKLAYPIAVRDQGIIAKNGGNVVTTAAVDTELAYTLPLYVPMSFTIQSGAAADANITLPKIIRDGRTQVQYIAHKGVDTQDVTFIPQDDDFINDGLVGVDFVYTVAAATGVNILFTLVSFHCPILGADSSGWVITDAAIN